MADTNPTQLPSVPLGEWNYIGTLTAPPASGQIRLNNAVQESATHMWVSKTTATSTDASGVLATVKNGQEVAISNKTDPTKTQTYVVSSDPVDGGTYVDFPVVWRRGGGAAIPAQRTLMDIVSTNVSATVAGVMATAAAGPAAVTASAELHVIAPIEQMQAHVGQAEIAGQVLIYDYAFPFIGKNYTNPGLTIRQHYATHAMMGFIAASNTNAANLIGKLAIYAFQVADSMIAHEEKERQGYSVPIVGVDRNAPAPKPTMVPPATPASAAQEQVPTGPDVDAIWPRKIIS